MKRKYKYQTKEMDELIEILSWSGIFSSDFRENIVRVWASKNIEEMILEFSHALWAQQFLTDNFMDYIVACLRTVADERKRIRGEK